MITRSGLLARCSAALKQPGLRRLQLAAVAAAAFRIEEQIVLLQDLGDVRLQRDQVRRVLRCCGGSESRRSRGWWSRPSGPPNRLMPAAMSGGRIPLSSSTSGSTR